MKILLWGLLLSSISTFAQSGPVDQELSFEIRKSVLVELRKSYIHCQVLTSHIEPVNADKVLENFFEIGLEKMDVFINPEYNQPILSFSSIDNLYKTEKRASITTKSDLKTITSLKFKMHKKVEQLVNSGSLVNPVISKEEINQLVLSIACN